MSDLSEFDATESDESVVTSDMRYVAHAPCPQTSNNYTILSAGNHDYMEDVSNDGRCALVIGTASLVVQPDGSTKFHLVAGSRRQLAPGDRLETYRKAPGGSHILLVCAQGEGCDRVSISWAKSVA